MVKVNEYKVCSCEITTVPFVKKEIILKELFAQNKKSVLLIWFNEEVT